jgi:WD40 repeat protein
VLAKHKSSVKQVRFQPGDDKIVATSSRDGAVQIWDLRCKGGDLTVHSAWGSDAPYASVVRTLSAAHADIGLPTNAATRVAPNSKTEAFSRRNDVSVTALSFMPEGRQHLLLTVDTRCEDLLSLSPQQDILNHITSTDTSLSTHSLSVVMRPVYTH